MQYKIHTIPIWDAFKTDCDCPLCKIESDESAAMIDMLSNEAVMVPIMRKRFNAHGLCRHHLKRLSEGGNLCGTALQLLTRIDKVLPELKASASPSAARKTAQAVRSSSEDCMVCLDLSELMERYYMTVAAMFYNEPPFRAQLSKTKGLCMYHFAKLTEHSAPAKNLISEYTRILTSAQLTRLTKLKNDLENFTEKFDYLKKDQPWGESKDAIPAAAKLLPRQKH